MYTQFKPSAKREKGRDLTQFYDEIQYTNEKKNKRRVTTQ